LNSSSSSHSSPPLLAPKLVTVLTFTRLDAAWVEVGPISIVGVCRWRRLYVPKSNQPIFLKTLDYALARSSSNHTGEPRHSLLVIISKVLSCLRLDRKVRQQFLALPTHILLPFRIMSMRRRTRHALDSPSFSYLELKKVKYLNLNLIKQQRVVAGASPLQNGLFSGNISLWQGRSPLLSTSLMAGAAVSCAPSQRIQHKFKSQQYFTLTELNKGIHPATRKTFTSYTGFQGLLTKIIIRKHGTYAHFLHLKKANKIRPYIG
jgi:hypothetical protein